MTPPLRGLPGPLIAAATLADVLDEVDVLDVRWTLGGPPGLAGFVSGHVPGARYADLETVFAQAPADPVDERGRHPLPDPDDLWAALGALGSTGARPVVLVDGGNLMAAARAWWVLRWTGWPAEAVAVLDGGQPAWDAACLPIETGPAAQTAPPRAARVQARPWSAIGGHLPTVDAREVAALAHDGRLLDARAPARWRGDVEPVDPRAGHIPGAVNLPWDADLGSDGRFRPPSELRALLVAAGLDDGRPIAVSCGSGVSAAHLVLAAEVAGLPLPALYPGSFSGWCADPGHPVETSPLPT